MKLKTLKDVQAAVKELKKDFKIWKPKDEWEAIDLIIDSIFGAGLTSSSSPDDDAIGPGKGPFTDEEIAKNYADSEYEMKLNSKEYKKHLKRDKGGK